MFSWRRQLESIQLVAYSERERESDVKEKKGSHDGWGRMVLNSSALGHNTKQQGQQLVWFLKKKKDWKGLRVWLTY